MAVSGTTGSNGGTGGTAVALTAHGTSGQQQQQQQQQQSTYAVSRSAELLSCAKTAVKIAQSRYAKLQQQREGEGYQPNSSASNEWFTHLNPSELELYNPKQQKQPHRSVSTPPHETGLSLLRQMAHELDHLEGLVRRRGHSNDPTHEISASVRLLERDASSLTILLQTMVPPSSKHSRSSRFGTGGTTGSAESQTVRHYQAIQQWLQTVASRHAARLKTILAVRGTVLTEQARRRQRFTTVNSSTTAAAHHSATTTTNNTTTTTGGHSSAAATRTAAAATKALFAMPPPVHMVSPPPWNQSTTTSSTTTRPPTNDIASNESYGPAATTATAAAGSSHTQLPSSPNAQPSVTVSAAYDNTGNGRSDSYTYGGSSGAGYGGKATSNGSNYNSNYYHSNDDTGSSSSVNGGMGMRQRKTDNSNGYYNSNTNSDSHTSQQQQQQHLVQQYEEQRQSAQRLKEAHQAEKSLAALGSVFGKMSTLLASQAETLQNIEDDVEAASIDVRAGHEQITILYAIKKGNRPLIIKVYALLIFFIVFMRFYVKKK